MHHNHAFRFCPVCGGKVAPKKMKPHEPERLVCGDCAYVFYLDPKLVACSIVEVGQRIVLLKRKYNPQKGKWVVPGGYVDRGEIVEAAAVRETFEECRIETRIKKLLGIYSYQDYMDVVVFYIAEAVSGEIRPGDETVDAAIVLPGEIPWEKLAFRSTTDALRDYCRLRHT